MRHFMQILVSTIASTLLTQSEAATATASVGQTATLSVTNDGTAPFTYQWSKDGNPIAGATDPVHVVKIVSAADAGQYKVIVANAAGTTTSDIATLNVVPLSTVDVSFAQTIANNFTVPAAQWYTVKGTPLADTGNHYDASTGYYTVGVGEAGTYQIILRTRVQDMAAENVSYSIGAWKANEDNVTNLWCTTFNHGSGWMRNGAVNIIEQHFDVGDQIRVLVYSEKSLLFYSLGFTIKLL